MKNRIIIFSALALAIAAALVVSIYRGHPGLLAVADPNIAAMDTPAEIVEYAPPINDIAPVGNHTYLNQTYNFSLQYPQDLQVAQRSEAAGGRTITFEDESGQYEFQIYIVPYADKQITKSRINLDTHGSAGTPQEIVFSNGTHALLFSSSDSILGSLREVWFIHGGYLFEVTTYAELDSWLSGIMRTWVFR